MKESVKRTLKALLRGPANAMIESSSHFGPRIERAIRRDVSIASRFVPYQPRSSSWTLPPPPPPPDAANLPVPPERLWLAYGRSVEQYLDGGRRHMETLRRELIASGTDISACKRILDFGCGAGRMLRWLAYLADECELWGADVSAEHILWCQQHLSPPFRFVTTTSCPHLPFEDCYFDLVYAGSVFTHIPDLADAWLLEIRRILRPGGLAYLTVHDRSTLQCLERTPRRPLARRLSSLPESLRFWRHDFGMFTIKRGFVSLVFYEEAFIRRHWGRFFDILRLVPEAYECQTALLLSKATGFPNRCRS